MTSQLTIQKRAWAIRIIGAIVLCASAVCSTAKEPNLSNYSSRRKEVAMVNTDSNEQVVISEVNAAI
jgi:hypothetical protein